MITNCPTTFPFTSPPGKRADTGPAFGVWRYEGNRRSRGALIVALVLSAVFHAAIFLVGPQRKAAVAPPKEEFLIQLSITIPEVQELEELDPIPNDDAEPPAELGLSIPMQADLPTIPQPTDFVQQIDFASLVEQPDLSQAKIMSIPDTVRRGRITEGLGQIFNLDDLDRVPEAVFQPAPIFPHNLKNEVSNATVVLDFVVNTEGRVVNVVVRDSTHRGFEYAAIAGIERWKFRAGMRGGRKVNTRMRVPINFRLVDDK